MSGRLDPLFVPPPPRPLSSRFLGPISTSSAAKTRPSKTTIIPPPSPTKCSNFFGVVNATTLAAADAALREEAAALARDCGGGGGSGGGSALPQPPPPLVSYTHYPLGLIASAPRPGDPAGGGRALAALLAAGGSAAHLSGHLHAHAGKFMRALHSASPEASRSLPEFELGDWETKRRWRLLAFDGAGVTVADFDFAGGRVRSLEAGATVAAHAVVVTHAAAAAAAAPADGGSGDADVAVRALVLPVSPAAPPVARAELRWACGGGASGPPADDDAAAGAAAVALVRGDADPRVSEAADGALLGGPAGPNSSSGGSDDATRLYSATLRAEAAAACARRGAALWVRAVAVDAEGGVSASPWRRAAPPSSTAAAWRAAASAGAEGEAALLAPNWRAAVMVGLLDWPGLLRRIAVTAGLTHLVLLLVVPAAFGAAIEAAYARLASAGGSSNTEQQAAAAAAAGFRPLPGGDKQQPHQQGATRPARQRQRQQQRSVESDRSRSPSPTPTPTPTSTPPLPPPSPPPQGPRPLACAGRVAAALAAQPLAAALWPCRTMAVCWRRNGRGALLAGPVALSLLALLGPWHLGRFSGGDAGLGAFFPSGVLLRPGDAGGSGGDSGGGGGAAPFVFYPCADASIGAAALSLVILQPLTLLLAHASNGMAARPAQQQDARSGGAPAAGAGRAAATPIGQACAAAWVAAMWATLAHRLWSTYGPAALLASPVVGWLPPLAAAWLLASRRRLQHQAAAAAATAAAAADPSAATKQALLTPDAAALQPTAAAAAAG